MNNQQAKNLGSSSNSSEDNPWLLKDDAYWQSVLTPEEFAVTRKASTEKPFSGQYCGLKEDGKYKCKCCQNLLFDSTSKFDSGTGWPSYFRPATNWSLIEKPDYSHGMIRTEVLCARCQAHLGHVFEDGPKPTGKRYCINSLALIHEKDEKDEKKN